MIYWTCKITGKPFFRFSTSDFGLISLKSNHLWYSIFRQHKIVGARFLLGSEKEIMGRGKIEIKKIENTNARHVSFSKRRQGLFKKARELAILCDADVAVIIFSGSGRVYEYSSSDMKNILSRFNECVETEQSRALELHTQGSDEVDVLRKEIEKLKSKQWQSFGEDLINMDLQELDALDKRLNEGLMFVKSRKEQILMQQIEQSTIRKQKMLQENHILQRQIEEIRRFSPPMNYMIAPLSTDVVPGTTPNGKPSDL